MPSRTARSRLTVALAAVISAAALALPFLPWQEEGGNPGSAGYAQPESGAAPRCSGRAAPSLGSQDRCPPPSEALPDRRHTVAPREGPPDRSPLLHNPHDRLRQDHAPDPMPDILPVLPLLPKPPLHILFCSWVV
jgi:hypothetical protein